MSFATPNTAAPAAQQAAGCTSQMRSQKHSMQLPARLAFLGALLVALIACLAPQGAVAQVSPVVITPPEPLADPSSPVVSGTPSVRIVVGGISFSCALKPYVSSVPLSAGRLANATMSPGGCPSTLYYGREMLNITFTYMASNNTFINRAILSARRVQMPTSANISMTLSTQPIALSASYNFSVVYDPVLTRLPVAEVNAAGPAGFPLALFLTIQEQAINGTDPSGATTSISAAQSFRALLLNVANATLANESSTPMTTLSSTATATSTGSATSSMAPRTIVIPAGTPTDKANTAVRAHVTGGNFVLTFLVIAGSAVATSLLFV
ncbi:hypothetical protein BC831DRAFT_444223 [Entophlyctis helioformis]|nr:hypothetical protein BC831DRAFT_444223 [Entophlyctis helioformis]